MSRSNKKTFFIFFAIVLPMAYFIDSNFLMLSRVDDQNWAPRGGRDYLIVGKDPLGKGDLELKGDTIKLLAGRYKGKELLVKYCILNNLWIESIDTKEIAWYTETMHY